MGWEILGRERANSLGQLLFESVVKSLKWISESGLLVTDLTISMLGTCLTKVSDQVRGRKQLQIVVIVYRWGGNFYLFKALNYYRCGKLFRNILHCSASFMKLLYCVDHVWRCIFISWCFNLSQNGCLSKNLLLLINKELFPPFSISNSFLRLPNLIDLMSRIISNLLLLQNLWMKLNFIVVDFFLLKNELLTP